MAKYVFPNIQSVCHAWANKTHERGRSGNVFFELDGTIYSYGLHFPVARHVTGKDGRAGVLFTDQEYSLSTSHHKSAVNDAIPESLKGTWHRGELREDGNWIYGYREDGTVFDVQDPTSDDPTGHLAYYKQRAREAIESAAAPRIRAGTRIRHLNGIGEWNKKAERLAAFYGVEFEPVEVPSGPEIDKLRERVKADEKAREDERKQKEAEREKQLAELRERALNSIEVWKNGGFTFRSFEEQNILRYLPEDAGHFARIKPRSNGQVVETTLKVEVPRMEAVKALKYALSVYRSSEMPHRPDERFLVDGSWSFDRIDGEGTVVIGCHRFKRAEVERLAGLFPELGGWEYGIK